MRWKKFLRDIVPKNRRQEKEKVFHSAPVNTNRGGILLFHKPPCLPSGTTMHESVSYEPPADVQKTERQVFWQLKEGLDEFLPDKAVLPGGTSFAFLFL